MVWEKRQLTWEEYRKIEAKEKAEREQKRFVASIVVSCTSIILPIIALGFRLL